MNQIINAQSTIINLDDARHKVVSGLLKTGEVLAYYGQGMNQAFDLLDNEGNITTKWYDRKGKLALPVKEERAKFVADMKLAGFEQGTIDTYWSRVKDASGRKAKAKNVVSGGVDVDAENIKTLKTILNRIDNANEDTAPLSFKVVALLVQAADLMGINVSEYAIGQDD